MPAPDASIRRTARAARPRSRRCALLRGSRRLVPRVRDARSAWVVAPLAMHGLAAALSGRPYACWVGTSLASENAGRRAGLPLSRRLALRANAPSLARIERRVLDGRDERLRDQRVESRRRRRRGRARPCGDRHPAAARRRRPVSPGARRPLARAARRSDRRVRRPRRRSAQEPRARARRAAAAPPAHSRCAICGSSDRRLRRPRRRRRVARRGGVGGRAAPRGVAARASVAPGGLRDRRGRGPRERRTRRVDAVRRPGGAAARLRRRTRHDGLRSGRAREHGGRPARATGRRSSGCDTPDASTSSASTLPSACGSSSRRVLDEMAA